MMILTELFESQLFGIVFWVAIMLIAIVIEVTTVQLVSIWFAGGAVVGIILAIFNVGFVWELLGFAVASSILLLLSKFVFKKKIEVKDTKTNSDSLVGLELIVTSRVTDRTCGEGKIRDVVWTVITNDNTPIESGEYAVIKEIVGNKLLVTRKDV